MKKLFLILAVLGLSGCAAYNDLTPRQQQTVAIVGSILVSAVIISANDGDTIINKPCHKHGKHHDKHHTCDD